MAVKVIIFFERNIFIIHFYYIKFEITRNFVNYLVSSLESLCFLIIVKVNSHFILFKFYLILLSFLGKWVLFEAYSCEIVILYIIYSFPKLTSVVSIFYDNVYSFEISNLDFELIKKYLLSLAFIQFNLKVQNYKEDK